MLGLVAFAVQIYFLELRYSIFRQSAESEIIEAFSERFKFPQLVTTTEGIRFTRIFSEGQLLETYTIPSGTDLIVTEILDGEELQATYAGMAVQIPIDRTNFIDSNMAALIVTDK